MIKPKKIIVASVLIVAVLSAVVGQIVYSNIAENKERARRVSQGQTVAVEISTVSRQNITPVLSFPAGLEAEWSAEISAKVDGRIRNLDFDEGDVIEPGAVIAVLDTEELSALVVNGEGTLFQAKANMEQAIYDLRRSEELLQKGAISTQEAENVRTRYRVASGTLRTAEGNLTLLETRLNNANIVSPQGGTVTKRHLQAGYYVKAGEPIITVANVKKLLAKATVGEAQITQVNIGDEVRVKVDAVEDRDFTGKISRLSPAAQLPSRTFAAEVAVEDEEGLLRPGMFATVIATGKVRENVLAVPETSLVMREDMKTVYVVLADNTVQQKTIKVGFIGGGWAQVLEGLAEGDRIVVSGQNKLRDGSKVREASFGEGEAG